MCLAVPGRIAEIIDEGDIAFRVGKVDFGGIRKEVNLAYTPEAEDGKYVLVHVGFAISVMTKKKQSASSNTSSGTKHRTILRRKQQASKLLSQRQEIQMPSLARSRSPFRVQTGDGE